jgi:hypothetical protein
MLTPDDMLYLKIICTDLNELNLKLANISRNSDMPEIDAASESITMAIRLIKGSLEIKR